jgi:hypothetical protein
MFLLLGSAPAAADSAIAAINTKSRCEVEAEFPCDGDCLDGWSTSCYFDSTKMELTQNLALELQKEKCFAFYESSSCSPCKNNHFVRSEEKLQAVSCPDFYEALKTKDKACNGCLKHTYSAGG